MTNLPSSGSWRGQALAALVLLLVIGVGAHFIWVLIEPLIPAIVVIVFLLVVYGVIFGRWRR